MLPRTLSKTELISYWILDPMVHPEEPLRVERWNLDSQLSVLETLIQLDIVDYFM